MDLDGDEYEKDDLVEELEAHALLNVLPHKSSGSAFQNRTDRHHKNGSQPSKRYFPRILLLSFTLAVVALLSLSGSVFSPEPQISGTILQCGRSQVEARRRNCSFDPMSFSWLPPACHDAELTAEFASLRPWRWYAAVEMPTTIEDGVDCFEPGCVTRIEDMKAVSNASVWAGEHDLLFVTREYHLWHCAYMWRKFHRAIRRGGPVDGYVDSLGHTEHCSMMLAMKDSSSDVDTIITVKFPTCLALGSAGGDAGRPHGSQTLLDTAE